MTEKAAKALAACGVERYNHDLETAKSFYSNIVTTHGYAERIDTKSRQKWRYVPELLLEWERVRDNALNIRFY